jgi:hypothetical protein
VTPAIMAMKTYFFEGIPKKPLPEILKKIPVTAPIIPIPVHKTMMAVRLAWGLPIDFSEIKPKRKFVIPKKKKVANAYQNQVFFFIFKSNLQGNSISMIYIHKGIDLPAKGDFVNRSRSFLRIFSPFFKGFNTYYPDFMVY